ncbi:glycoside hydrolase family 43 protein [Oerskovia jenensis]|uniref:Alpha-N-arabinofuranosidase n=1 Tax=Oerskovia jenensis TaxID=162169 RepID=A0ABS2LFD8_9CELL|nr:glycoside hydrolase family 43 protein [Oerskovia jenensis]MBM7479145.1 alpha-N-arabinofuranosidase [Oerskovia jenensis]
MPTSGPAVGALPAGTTFTNPVLPGTHPDPSVCRVPGVTRADGTVAPDDYYLVTSTFEYFPGLPVFHSHDLVAWTQVGHAIHRTDQVDLSSVPSSGGLYAATIRHHDGTFYVVTTLVHTPGQGGHLLVTATDPAGPWSDPVWLEGEGIDPSLFVDDSTGRVWLTATRLADPGEWEGQTEVWLRELDLAAGALVGPEHVLWRGALHGAVWAEGPHLYRVGDHYYLLASEGGTEHRHAVSVARADAVTGPYTGNPANPVLTHRHLGRDFPVVGVGHADLVETAAGEWWMVLLGSRPYGGYFPNLGRETFLAPVVWEDGWPVVAPGVGHVAGRFPRPDVGARLPGAGSPALSRPSAEVGRLAEAGASGEVGQPSVVGAVVVHETFDGPGEGLDLAWNQVRTGERFWSLTERPWHLRLPLLPATLSDVATPAFLGRRQQHTDMDLTVRVDVDPAGPDEWAGLAVRQSEDAWIAAVVTRAASADDSIGDSAGATGGRELLVVERFGGEEVVVGRAALGPLGLAEGPVDVVLHAVGQEYGFGVRTLRGFHAVATVHGGRLSSPEAGGFLGVWVGPYATGRGTTTATVADVECVEYRGRRASAGRRTRANARPRPADRP